MTELVIKREPSTKTSTPGIMYRRDDGVDKFLCYTLEDVVRDLKIPRVTAIPAGTYDLKISMSTRFKKDLPIVLDVPEFTGVRIHGGNTHENTEGCPLVGTRRDSKDRISNCAPAVEMVMRIIRESLAETGKCRLIVESAK